MVLSYEDDELKPLTNRLDLLQPSSSKITDLNKKQVEYEDEQDEDEDDVLIEHDNINEVNEVANHGKPIATNTPHEHEKNPEENIEENENIHYSRSYEVQEINEIESAERYNNSGNGKDLIR